MLNKKPETTGRVIPGINKSNWYNFTHLYRFCQSYLAVIALIATNLPVLVGTTDSLYREVQI